MKHSPRQVHLHTAPTTYGPPPSSSYFCGGGPQIQGENQATQVARTIEYRGVLGTILTMVRTEGPRSLYNGLVAGLQRQMSFASVRIGLYDSVKQFYTPKGSDRECSWGIRGQGRVGGSTTCGCRDQGSADSEADAQAH